MVTVFVHAKMNDDLRFEVAIIRRWYDDGIKWGRRDCASLDSALQSGWWESALNAITECIPDAWLKDRNPWEWLEDGNWVATLKEVE